MADELFQLPETPTPAIAPENQIQNGGFQGLEKNQISNNPLGTKTPPTFGDVLSFVNAKYAKENPYKKSESLFMPLAKTPLSDIPYTVDPEIGYSAFSSDKERNDAYSAKQSAIGNIGRNLIGFASNAISTAIGDFDYAQEYNINGAGFDKDSFKNTLIDWAEEVQKDNYVHPTSYIEEHPWLSFVNPLELRSLTDRWGGILPSLGFTAGSIANAIATDMAIASVTGIGELGLLPAQASKIVKGLFAGFKEKKALSSIAETAQAVKTLSTTNKVGNAMRQGFALYNSALGEATMEGYMNFKDTKSKMIEDYKNTYGLDPTPEDLKSMDDTARSAGTASVYANTALLMATNFLEFGSIFKPTAALTREATNAMTEGKIITKSIDEAATIAEKKLTLLERTSRSLTNAVKKSESIPRIMLTEGFEEGAQFTISQKEKDYWSRKYNNTDEADQNWKSWMYGINQTFSTREGMENIVMGALAGPSIHGVSNLYKGLKARMSGVSLKDQRAHALASTVNVINSVGISGMFGDGYDGLVTSQENAKGMKESLKNNDLGSFKNFKMDQLFNKVHTALKTNHFDIVGEQLDMASNLTGSNFETISGMQDTQENRAIFKQYVEKVKQKTNDIKATINDVEGAFGTNPFNPKNDNISYKAFNNYKEALAHTLVTVKDSSQRYEQLISEVKRISPNTNTDKIERMLSPKGIKETHAEVKARIKELEDAETNSASNPELQKQFTDEKNTLLEHVDNLDKLANNKEVGSNTYKDTFDGMLDYYSKSAKNNKFDSVSNTDKVFTRLFDAQRLVDRAKTAKDLYKTLTKKEGFNTFKAQVQDIIENKFESRLRWDENNNLNILSAKQLEEEKAKKKAEGVKGLEEIKNELIQQKAIQTVEEGFSEEELNKIIELKQKELSSTKELTQDEIDAIEKERADVKERAKNGVYDDRFKGNTYEEHVANIDKYFDDKLKNKNSLTDEEKEILFNYRDKIDQEAMRLNGEFEKDIDLEKLVEELGPEIVEQMIRARHNEPSFTKDVDISSISNLFGTMPYFLHTPELVNLFNQVKNGNPQLYGAFIQKTNLFDFLFNQAEAKLVNESNVENLVKSNTSKNKKDFIKARIENMFQSAFGKNGSKVRWMTSKELQAKIDSTKNAKYDVMLQEANKEAENIVPGKDDIDENGNLLTHNGQISNLDLTQWKLVRTKAFKNWYGDWEKEVKRFIQKEKTYLEKEKNKTQAEIDYENSEFDKAANDINYEPKGLKEPPIFKYDSAWSTNLSIAFDLEKLEPTVYYHGTDSDIIKSFNPALAKNSAGLIWFSKNKEKAKLHGKNIIPVFLKIPAVSTIALSEPKSMEDVKNMEQSSIKGNEWRGGNVGFTVNNGDEHYASLIEALDNDNLTSVIDYIEDDYVIGVSPASLNKIKIADGTNNTFGNTNDIRNNFVGEKGAARLQNMVSNNLMNKLIEAKQMEKDGINPIDIYEKTGWQKNKNNEWRTETNYKLNFLNNFNSFKNNFPRDNVMQLDNIIDYPQLFAAYPELKKLKLVYLDQKYYEDDGTMAAYSNTTISPGILKSNSHLKGTKHIIVLHSIPETQDGLKRILLHELQHAIQFIENKKETFNAPEDSRLTDLNNKLAELEKIATLTKKQLKEYSNLSKQKEDLLYELYFNNPVEVEARNVENRSLLSEEERKQLPISTTEFIELNQKYNFVGENAILPETIRTSLSTARILEKAYKLPDNYWELYPMRSQDLKTDKQDEVYDKVMQIYTGTGWQRGVDGLWRYDMGVQDYIFLPGIEGNEFYEKKNYSTTLDKVIESKSLYEAYPELAKINIVLAPGEKSIKRIYKNGEFKDEEYTSSGLWSPSTNTITIDSTVDAYEQYNILLHELQHAIQDKEGFATGSSTEEAEERLLTDNEKLLGNGKKYEDILKTYNENILMYGKNNEQNKKIDAEIEKLKEAIKKKFKVNSWDDLVTAVYEGSVGEVEARNVSYRKNLSEEERRQYLLSETEDVALEQKSILFKTFRPVASVTQKLSKDEISKKLNEKFNPDYKNTIVEKLAKFDEQIKNKKFPSALEVAEHVLPRNIFNRYKNLYELAAKNNITVSNEKLPSGITAAWAFNSIQLNKVTAKYYINDYEEFAETLNHEIIHGLLSRGIKNNYNLFNDLQNIMTQVLNKFDSASEEVKNIISYIEDTRNEFKEKDFLNSTNKEIGNLEELLTYAFTNKEFANFLDSIPASKNIKAEGNSIFQQLKNIIRDYIKSITNKSTALDEINSILDKYFDTTFNEKDIAKRNKEYNWGLTFKANENVFDKYNNDPKTIMDAYNLNKDTELVKAVENIIGTTVSKAQLSKDESAIKFGTAFDIQDETAENTVSTKSLWGKAQVWRERIENAGDILRELSSRGDKPDVRYLMEKVEKLRDWIAKSKEGYTPIDKSIKTIEEFEKTNLKWSDAVDSREYIEKFHSTVLDRIKSEYEAIPTYTKEQRLAVDLVLDLINNNIKGLESKLNEIETIANQIKTNGTLPIIADIKLGKSNIEDSDSEIIYSTNKSGILGFTSGNDIFLNSDALIGKSNNEVDGNTPIHEAGHLWLKWAKANNTALYEKGMSLVEGSSYLKKVMSDPFYKEEAKRFKTKKERDDFFKDEALARAIGDRGGEFLQESTKRDFKQWLTNLFNSVMDFLGIRNLTEEEIDKLTFDQFTKMVAADIISGQNINDKTNIRNNSVERGVQYGIKIENDDTADEEKFTRISNQLFRGQSKTKAFLEAGGKRITQITGVNTIFAKIENEYVPLMEAFNKNLINSKNFKNITGVDLKNMPDYLANLKAYSDLADSLFKSNKKDFTDEEVRNLINVRPLLGGRDQVNRADKATTLEDLKALGKNSYILSFTNTYDKKGRKLDTKIYVIDKNGSSLLNPNHEIYKLVMDNMDMLEKNSKRYVLVNRQPSGNFANTSFIFGRAKQVSRSVTDSLVSAISENDMEETKKILDTLFISDKSGQFKGKIDMMAALDEIRPSDRQRITSLEFLAKALNQTSYMQDREIEIETDSFNYHIPKDEEAKFSDFNKTLTLAVKPNIYSNINLVIYPKGLNESIKNKEEVKTEEAPAEEVVTKKTKTKKSKAKQNTVSLTYENETLDIDNDIDSKVAEEIVNKYEDILQKLQDNKTITKEPCA